MRSQPNRVFKLLLYLGAHHRDGDFPRDGDPKKGGHHRDGDHPKDGGCLRDFLHPTGWLLDIGSVES